MTKKKKERHFFIVFNFIRKVQTTDCRFTSVKKKPFPKAIWWKTNVKWWLFHIFHTVFHIEQMISTIQTVNVENFDSYSRMNICN